MFEILSYLNSIDFLVTNKIFKTEGKFGEMRQSNNICYAVTNRPLMQQQIYCNYCWRYQMLLKLQHLQYDDI